MKNAYFLLEAFVWELTTTLQKQRSWDSNLDKLCEAYEIFSSLHTALMEELSELGYTNPSCVIGGTEKPITMFLRNVRDILRGREIFLKLEGQNYASSENLDLTSSETIIVSVPTTKQTYNTSGRDDCLNTPTLLIHQNSGPKYPFFEDVSPAVGETELDFESALSADFDPLLSEACGSSGGLGLPDLRALEEFLGIGGVTDPPSNVSSDEASGGKQNHTEQSTILELSYTNLPTSEVGNPAQDVRKGATSLPYGDMNTCATPGKGQNEGELPICHVACIPIPAKEDIFICVSEEEHYMANTLKEFQKVLGPKRDKTIGKKKKSLLSKNEKLAMTELLDETFSPEARKDIEKLISLNLKTLQCYKLFMLHVQQILSQPLRLIQEALPPLE